MIDHSGILKSIGVWRNWLIVDALPRWAESIDASGLPYEALTKTGEPDLNVPRRTRTIARQLWAHAVAEKQGWGAKGVAIKIYPRFIECCWATDGEPGFINAISAATCQPVDSKRDLYDHACALLALAALWDITRDSKILSTAKTTLRFLDGHLRHVGQPGYAENNLHSLPRRQNPHMHLLEALLAWRALGVEEISFRVDDLLALFERHFLSASVSAVQEFFMIDFSPAEGELGLSVEPGHQFEWVWLLHRANQLGFDVPSHLIDQLFAWGWHNGRNDLGFAIDEIDVTGQCRRRSRRTWNQMEMLRAMAIQIGRGNEAVAQKFPEISERVFSEYFRVASHGLWVDAYSEIGQPSATSAPGSTLYHAIGMIREFDELASQALEH
jgi:mannose/cellobiose epimerase-like protein (N-acyl-D-glucosamine 2-epimerase family)